MQVLNPIRNHHFSQRFSESRACVRNGKVVKKNKEGCPSGYTDLYNSLGLKGHNGWDFASYKGANIYFPVLAGVSWVAWHEIDSHGGLGVDVFSKNRVLLPELPPEAGPEAQADWEANKHRVYVKFRFWHNEKNVVGNGKQVKAGDVIATVGETGLATGPHLHWSMKFVDKNGATLDRWNGYSGAVNFKQYYNDTFVLDEMGEEEELKPSQKLSNAYWYLKAFGRAFQTVDEQTLSAIERVRNVLIKMGL